MVLEVQAAEPLAWEEVMVDHLNLEWMGPMLAAMFAFSLHSCSSVLHKPEARERIDLA